MIYIVGAGMTGCVLAERISNVLARPVTIIDSRDHIGGNCWDEVDNKTGILCHKYGSHIFHTSDQNVWKYISQFTDWTNYQHRVWISYKGKTYPMPINLHTINTFFNKNFTPAEAKNFLKAERDQYAGFQSKNFEEKAISQIGKDLYEAFIKGYTAKQWEKNPRELNAEIFNRLPVRFNYNNRYFDDTYEGLPLNGYTAIFKKMLSSQLINIKLNTSWSDIRDNISNTDYVFFTGPIDQYFDYRLGRLEWRTLDFEIEHPDTNDFQGTSVMNYSDENIPYTRIHEFKHYLNNSDIYDKTVIYKEYSRFATINDLPYYPINTENNKKMYSAYLNLAKIEKNTFFAGRLGLYRYLDMDDAIASALNIFEHSKQIIASRY